VKYKNNLEGKIIVLPLEKGGYATGLIARQDRNILLGYFFDTYYQNPPLNIKEWSVSEVCLICLFGILGINNNEWKILGDMPLWKRDEWIVPIFKQQDILNPEQYYSIIYQDDLKEYERKKASKEEVQKYYSYGIFGYGAVEIALSEKCIRHK
jgi:hypothetical protein